MASNNYQPAAAQRLLSPDKIHCPGMDSRNFVRTLSVAVIGLWRVYAVPHDSGQVEILCSPPLTGRVRRKAVLTDFVCCTRKYLRDPPVGADSGATSSQTGAASILAAEREAEEENNIVPRRPGPDPISQTAHRLPWPTPECALHAALSRCNKPWRTSPCPLPIRWLSGWTPVLSFCAAPPGSIMTSLCVQFR